MTEHDFAIRKMAEQRQEIIHLRSQYERLENALHWLAVNTQQLACPPIPFEKAPCYGVGHDTHLCAQCWCAAALEEAKA